MSRFKELTRYQKGILLFLAALVAVFTAVYSRTTARVGFAYKDAILIPSQENGSTLYSGQIQGEPACFTVFPDKTVTFQYGTNLYGPYTAKEDASAVPKEEELAGEMTGMELRCGEEVLFRGGVMDFGSYRWFYNEDGTLAQLNITVESAYGIAVDENGEEIDPMEPSVSVILDLMDSPRLEHKGDWRIWLLTVCLCAFTAISILFADDLFYMSLMFTIRNAEQAEPSDWEIASRYIGWTILSFAAVYFFLTGLQ